MSTPMTQGSDMRRKTWSWKCLGWRSGVRVRTDPVSDGCFHIVLMIKGYCEQIGFQVPNTRHKNCGTSLYEEDTFEERAH